MWERAEDLVVEAHRRYSKNDSGTVAEYTPVLGVGRAVLEHPELSPTLIAQVNMDDIDFVSNDDLGAVLENTDATPEQVEAAVTLNEEARLGTLRLGLLALAGISTLAILPASRLPRYKPDEIPDPSPVAPERR